MLVQHHLEEGGVSLIDEPPLITLMSSLSIESSAMNLLPVTAAQASGTRHHETLNPQRTSARRPSTAAAGRR